MADLVTSADFMGIFNEIKALIPVILPTVVAFLGFRKAWSFLRGEIAGA